jgi:hypothetical protein
MDYKSSILIFLEITSVYLTPDPLRDFKKTFFKIYLLKVPRVIKSNTLITNIAVSKFKNVFLKNTSIFPASGFMGSNRIFDPPPPPSHID